MAKQEQPRQSVENDERVPDTARVYERAKPEKEAGMGRLEDDSRPADAVGDRGSQAVKNRQDPSRSINADDAPAKPETADRAIRQQPDHSMKDEEPLGWDQAPMDIHNPREKRHPRPKDPGGTR